MWTGRVSYDLQSLTRYHGETTKSMLGSQTHSILPLLVETMAGPGNGTTYHYVVYRRQESSPPTETISPQNCVHQKPWIKALLAFRVVCGLRAKSQLT